MMRLSRLARSAIWEQIAAVALGVNAFERHDDAEQDAHFARAVRLAVDTDNEVQLGVALWALAAVRAGARPEAAARLWGAARHRSPLPPLHRRRYGAWIDVARTRLGHGRFAHLEREGARPGRGSKRRFPMALIIPQSATESVLGEALVAAGGVTRGMGSA